MAFDRTNILAKIDVCVSCGLCLNSCPTYRVNRTEAASPRGRLSIIQALILENVTPSKLAFSHIDDCLACGVCERSCPAEVHYLDVLSHAKQLFNQNGYQSNYDKVFNWLVYKPWRLNVLGKALHFYKAIGLQVLLPIPALKGYLEFTYKVIRKEYFPASRADKDKKIKGDVYLFRGCVASLFDQDTIESAIAMLNIAGFNVLMPNEQRCCGLMASSCGDAVRSAKLQAANGAIFTRDIPLIVTSTGCFESVRKFSKKDAKIYDVMEFLQKHTEVVIQKITGQAVMVHIPCSQRNRPTSIKSVLELDGNDSYKEIDVVNGCCGGAGTYMYRNSKISSKIVSPIVKQLDNSMPDVVLTQNIGCRMQLMNKTGKTVKQVMHPVTFIYQNLYRTL